MAKRQNNPPKDPPSSASEWLEGRLEGFSMDLDALSSMSSTDIEKELSANGASSTHDFIASLNERLPEGAAIKPPKKKRKPRAATKRSPKRADRPVKAPAPTTPQRVSLRVFNVRNAVVASLFIIAASILIPQLIKSIRNVEPTPAVNPIEADSVLNQEDSPTTIEGRFPNLRLRGVRYTADFYNLEPTFTPLPPNPDSLQAVFVFNITVDSAGGILDLEPVRTENRALENAVIDSLLKWKFNRNALASEDSMSGVLTIRYFPE